MEEKPNRGYGPDADSNEDAELAKKIADSKVNKGKGSTNAEIIEIASSDSDSYTDAKDGLRRSSRESIPTDMLGFGKVGPAANKGKRVLVKTEKL